MNAGHAPACRIATLLLSTLFRLHLDKSPFSLARRRALLLAVPFAAMLTSGCVLLPQDVHYSYTSSEFPLQPLWEVQLDQRVARSPVVNDEIIVAITKDASLFSYSGSLVAIDQKLGTILWTQKLANVNGSTELLIHQNRVIIGTDDGFLSVYDLASGQLRWSEAVGHSSSSLVSDIVTNEDTVFSVAQPTQIEARSIDTGDLKWRISEKTAFHSGFPTRVGSLHISGSILYLLPEPVVMIDAETGEIRDLRDVRRTKGSSHSDRMYLGDHAYSFPELDTVVTYKTSTAGNEERDCSRFNSRFTFASDLIFAVGSCGGVYKLNRDGVTQWIYEPTLIALPTIAFLDDTVYVLMESGEIHAIDASTGMNQGALILSQPLPGIYWGSNEPSRGIHTSGNAIIITFGNQQVWAFSR